MHSSSDSCLALLTYKGKILLKLFEDDPLIFNNPYLVRTHRWELIGGRKAVNESYLDTVLKKIEKTTNIKLTNINLLSTVFLEGQKQYFCHAKLTDEQVNNIVRREGHLLQFFSFKEVESLSLSETAQLFISKHRDYMEKIYINPISN